MRAPSDQRADIVLQKRGGRHISRRPIVTEVYVGLDPRVPVHTHSSRGAEPLRVDRNLLIKSNVSHPLGQTLEAHPMLFVPSQASCERNRMKLKAPEMRWPRHVAGRGAGAYVKRTEVK